MKAVINSTLLSQIKPSQKQYDIWDTKLTGFILRVNPNGNHVYRCEYARGKRVTIGSAKILTPMQARDRAKEILADAVKGIDPGNKKNKADVFTLKSFIENEYLPWAKAQRKSGVDTVARIKRCFFQEFGDKAISDFSALELEKWRTQKINRGCKILTVNRDVITLRAAIAKAVEWGFLEKHPLAALKLLKTDTSPKVRYLDYEEEKRLREALDVREEKIKDARTRANQWREERGYELLPSLNDSGCVDYLKPMVLLSLNTGMRRGELFSLRWDNVDLHKNVLTIAGESAKSGKTRHIPLNEEAKAILLLWSAQQNERNELIFSNRDGQRLTHVKRSWANLLRDAQIKNFRWHDMRHHFASCLVMAGVDLNTVRELLGHSDIKMTLRYAHLAPEHKAEAVARLTKRNLNLTNKDMVAA